MGETADVREGECMVGACKRHRVCQKCKKNAKRHSCRAGTQKGILAGWTPFLSIISVGPCVSPSYVSVRLTDRYHGLPSWVQGYLARQKTHPPGTLP